jgi:competence protein ComFC
VPEKSLKGKTVIVVDDVVTTGSSLAACASLIRGMGTRKIIGATLSIAYKDSYIKPRTVYNSW